MTRARSGAARSSSALAWLSTIDAKAMYEGALVHCSLFRQRCQELLEHADERVRPVHEEVVRRELVLGDPAGGCDALVGSSIANVPG